MLTERVKFAWSLAGLLLLDAAAFFGVLFAKSAIADVSVPPRLRLAVWALVFGFSAATVATAYFAYRWRERFRRPVLCWLLVSAPLWLFALLFPAIGSADSWWNSLMTRVWTQYHANPYLVTPADFAGDAVFTWVSPRWRHATQVYGPWWMLLSAVPALLLGNHPWLTDVALKALAAAGYLLAGWWLFRGLSESVRTSGWGRAALIFWFLNPAALFEFANAGHNDGLVTAGLALLVVGLARSRPAQATFGVLLAAMVKYWPLLLAVTLLDFRHWSRRAWLKSLLMGVAAAVSFLPFWAGSATFATLISRQQLLMDGHFAPLLFVFYRFVEAVGWSPTALTRLANWLPNVLLLGAVGIAAVQVWRRRWSGLAGARLVVVTLLLVGTVWLPPWYLLAVLPIFWPSGEKDDPARHFRLLVWLSITAFVMYGGIVWLLRWLAVSLVWWGWRRFSSR